MKKENIIKVIKLHLSIIFILLLCGTGCLKIIDMSDEANRIRMEGPPMYIDKDNISWTIIEKGFDTPLTGFVDAYLYKKVDGKWTEWALLRKGIQLTNWGKPIPFAEIYGFEEYIYVYINASSSSSNNESVIIKINRNKKGVVSKTDINCMPKRVQTCEMAMDDNGKFDMVCSIMNDLEADVRKFTLVRYDSMAGKINACCDIVQLKNRLVYGDIKLGVKNNILSIDWTTNEIREKKYLYWHKDINIANIDNNVCPEMVSE